MRLELNQSHAGVSRIDFGECTSSVLGHEWLDITGLEAGPRTTREITQCLWRDALDAASPGLVTGLVVQMYTPEKIDVEMPDIASDIRPYLDDDTLALCRFSDELSELAGLDDDWYDSDSTAPGLLALRLARRISFALSADGLPMPHAYPTPEGGVSLEWTLGPLEASVAIERESGELTFSVWNSLSDEHEYREGVQATVADVRDWVDKLSANL